MASHAFVDESARRSYLIAAALVDGAQLDRSRRVLRDLRKPGQRRVHFAKESDSRRRTVLSALVGLDLRIRIYECVAPDVPARSRCLGELVTDLVDLGIENLVLETLEPQVRADRATIRGSLDRNIATLRYEHRPAHEEPLLWAADAAAWCHGAGGDWRRRIAPLLDKAVRLEP